MKALNIPLSRLEPLIASLSQKLNDQFFSGSKNFITGEEIIKFSSHRQINNFILFQIYQDWNSYIQKIGHPFYDFSHEEVRKSMSQFLNVLSGHLRVSRQDFRSIVEKAVFNTLNLTLNPTEAFSSFFFLNKE